MGRLFFVGGWPPGKPGIFVAIRVVWKTDTSALTTSLSVVHVPRVPVRAYICIHAYVYLDTERII